MGTRIIRLGVSEDLFADLQRLADAEGVPLETLCKRLLSEYAKAGANVGTDSVVDFTTPLDDDEKRAIREWDDSVLIGDARGMKPSEWRIRMDRMLRSQGNDMPPLPDVSTPRDRRLVMTLAWIHVAHNVLPGMASRPTPPRYPAE